MFRRTMIFSGAFLVFAVAVMINLAILDIIPFQEVKRSLRKLLAVTAVSTVALLLLYKLFALAMEESPGQGKGPERLPGEKTGKPAPPQGKDAAPPPADS